MQRRYFRHMPATQVLLAGRGVGAARSSTVTHLRSLLQHVYDYDDYMYRRT